MEQNSDKKMLFEMMSKVTGMELNEEYNDYKQLGVTPSSQEFKDEYGRVLQDGVHQLEVAIGKLFTMTKDAINSGEITLEEGLGMIDTYFQSGQKIHPVLSNEYGEYLKTKLSKFVEGQ